MNQPDFREVLNTMLLANGAMLVVEKTLIIMTRHSV